MGGAEGASPLDLIRYHVCTVLLSQNRLITLYVSFHALSMPLMRFFIFALLAPNTMFALPVVPSMLHVRIHVCTFCGYFLLVLLFWMAAGYFQPPNVELTGRGPESRKIKPHYNRAPVERFVRPFFCIYRKQTQDQDRLQTPIQWCQKQL